MLKRLISALLVCALCTLPSLFSLTILAEPHGEAVISPSALSAQAAILTDGNAAPLFEKNADRRMGPASTTKLMTALVVAESCAKDTEVRIPDEAVGIEGSSIYLQKGEILTVEHLLYALLLASANDAATALAVFCAGNVDAFCEKMNEKAISLGLADTHFCNPHGLADDNHYTTARDLAVIATAVLRHPLLREIVSTYKKAIPLCGTEGTRVLVNHNKMLRLYDGAIGCKTGFTKKTGRTLVSAAERDGLLLIAVTLDAPNDWNDHTQLLDYGFANYRSVTVFDVTEPVGALPVCGGTEDSIALVPLQTLSLTLKNGISVSRCTVEATGHFLYAPVKIDTPVARAICRVGNETYEVALVASHDVPINTPKPQSPLDRILHFFKPDEE